MKRSRYPFPVTGKSLEVLWMMSKAGRMWACQDGQALASGLLLAIIRGPVAKSQQQSQIGTLLIRRHGPHAFQILNSGFPARSKEVLHLVRSRPRNPQICCRRSGADGYDQHDPLVPFAEPTRRVFPFGLFQRGDWLFPKLSPAWENAAFPRGRITQPWNGFDACFRGCRLTEPRRSRGRSQFQKIQKSNGSGYRFSFGPLEAFPIVTSQ